MDHRAEAKRILAALPAGVESNELAIQFRILNYSVIQTHALMALLDQLDEIAHLLREQLRQQG